MGWVLFMRAKVRIFVAFQKRAEDDLRKLNEKIAKTRAALQDNAPRYDEMRVKEEQAAAQWVFFSPLSCLGFSVEWTASLAVTLRQSVGPSTWGRGEVPI